MSVWRAHLVVESSTCSLGELERALGVLSEGGHALGDARRVVPGVFEVSSWRLPLWWRASRHGGVDGIDRALRGLPGGLADRIRARVDAGDSGSLVIVQEMDGDDPSGSRGLSLSVEAFGWLARAGLSLDVDQYADLVDEPDDVGPDYRPPLDLGGWRAAMARSLRRFEGVVGERLGYPVESGSNRATSSGTASCWRPVDDVPGSLVRFYDVVGEVSATDVHIGYVIHPAARITETGRGDLPREVQSGGRRRVVVFGSDGGGGLFAIDRADGTVVHLPPGQVADRVWFAGTEGPRTVAVNLDEFLRRLLDVVDELIETGDTQGL